LLREFQHEIDADRFLRAVLRRDGAADTSAFDVSVEERVKTVVNAAIATTISREHSSIVGAFDAPAKNTARADALDDLRRGSGSTGPAIRRSH
jgi:hypothetical protein